MSEARDRGASGGIYNPVTLRLYDAGVLGLTNRLIWRCPTATMVEHYRSHAGRSHLDVGPGTGYFLERIDSPSLTLLDLNASCLAAASDRVGHGRSVASLQQSFFDPLPREHSFDSIGLNFLLHCIPSHEKWDRLSQLRGHLRPGGTIFGSTLIPDPETATLAARALNSTYNKLGVFGNADDTMDELENALRGYTEVSTRRVGQVALFSARRPQEDHT
ncbi:class I SAM-dependent methyltransferase [Dietzia cinnamea]|uniref:Class I SAM-dependent methyltransferase n=1 Tax=Dietzia cinnamea TaxID=321318 RepID=A0ABV3YCX3_9ACTN